MPRLRTPSAETDCATILTWRREQRTALIRRRMALPRDAHLALAKPVLQTLVTGFPDLWTGKVGIYWPCRGEISLLPLARQIMEAGGVVALPAPTGERQPLQFRAWAPGDPLATAPTGVSYPRDGHWVQPDTLLVALVGFDAANFRLGYGGGGYDRTLAAARRPRTIGVGFELMRLKTIHPLPHDVPMDVIVTEGGVFRRGRSR